MPNRKDNSIKYSNIFVALKNYELGTSRMISMIKFTST